MVNKIGLPIKAPEGILFTLKDIVHTPETPKMNQPFTVKGKVDLLKIPFMAPCWVITTVTYPEKWWEEIIPIWGSPEKREMVMAVGGDFEVSFPRGLDREGEFSLAVRLYPGPTIPLNAITIPPVPAAATFETTFAVIGEMPPPEKRFILEKPTVKPATTVDPGTEITISCPVRSESTEEESIRVRCAIYEGSFLPGRGTKIADYVSDVTPIAPGETKTFDFKHTTITGTIDRRDVDVALYVNTEIVKSEEWDDLYYVGRPPEEKIDFELTRPSVTPAEITPGTVITITCPITSGCDKEQTVTAKCIIYEGSVLPTHGTRITTKTSAEFVIMPGETKNMVVTHTAIEGTIDRRDVEVEVYIAGKMVKEDEWDDVYYVKRPEVELETLEVKIDPAGAGYVTVSLAPTGGTQHYWDFPHGTVVYVTAHPNPGYIFKSWSGEMKDTTAITAPVYPMTEKRTITAHFEMIKEYSLSISVTPYGAGTVTKSPDKTRYAEGEYVTLTAKPASGYQFDHWSGDVSGYSSSVTIYMNKDKSVVANFEKAVPPPTAKVSFTVKGDGFPFATSYWKLYHYDRSGHIWQDYTLHRPGDIIHVRNVESAGYLSCHCCNAFTGEWSDQKYSREFAAIDGKDYRYDIASGIIYYR